MRRAGAGLRSWLITDRPIITVGLITIRRRRNLRDAQGRIATELVRFRPETHTPAIMVVLRQYLLRLHPEAYTSAILVVLRQYRRQCPQRRLIC